MSERNNDAFEPKTGLTSLGKLAFSFGNPGQDLNETAFQEWLRANFVSGANIAENSALKRLCFELPRFEKRGLVFRGTLEDVTATTV